MSQIRVFVSFDTEHDAELYKLLIVQSRASSSSFAVMGGSERLRATDAWSERVRRRIGEADQVIVICGEHTEASMGVFAELRITQDEKKPYLLLWGRREIMCTKPAGTKPSECMYSWTQQILQEQIAQPLRKALADVKAATMRNATRRG